MTERERLQAEIREIKKLLAAQNKTFSALVSSLNGARVLGAEIEREVCDPTEH